MNKYQKIALAAGVIILAVLFGKTVTQIGLRAVSSLFALMGKFLILIIAVIVVVSFLKKARKKR